MANSGIALAGRPRKQNCFDDFIACADHLHDTGITRHERLAIMGGSNGGLLMGAVLTQRPDIACAVVAAVPVIEPLRNETSTNGKFNIPEYGTVEDPEQFAALLAYSPYHNVVDGTAYPAVLLTAGEHDSRVDAWHAKKMTARLQQATVLGPARAAEAGVRRPLGRVALGLSTRQRTGTPSSSIR